MTPPQHEERVEDIVQELHYVSDAEGNPVSVIVPIDLWREIEAERETAYLLRSEPMRRRLMEAKVASEGFTLEQVRANLGICPPCL